MIRRIWINLGQALRLVWQGSPRWTLLSSLVVLVQGLLPLVSLWLLKLLVDAVAAGLQSPEPQQAFRAVAWLLALTAVTVLVSDLCRAVTNLAGTAQAEAVQDHVYDVLHAKSIALDLAYYEDATFHDTLHRAQREAAYRPHQILQELVLVGQNAVSLVGIGALLASLHWLLAALLVGAVVPGLLVRLAFARRLYQRQRDWTVPERRADYLHELLRAPAFAREIRVFDLGALFRDRFRDLRRQIREERLVLARTRSAAEFATQAGATLALFVALGAVAYQTLLGALTLGGLVMFFQAFQRAQTFLWGVLTSLARLYESSLFLTDFNQFLQLEPRVVEPRQPRPLPRPLPRGLRFEHVHFGYPPAGGDVLRGLDLTVEPGQTIALVGENGAGKTTLVKLLCRLYDPTAGRITLGGVDLRELGLADLRREVTVLFQDFARYNVTASENIRLGSAHDALPIPAIHEAARCAGAEPPILRLPHGYDTVLGREFEEGVELSHGEWQRVALARAFVRPASIMVLDEPTSALDPAAEQELMDRLRRLLAGRMGIIISHRLALARWVDCIHVLHQGRIIESGSHAALVGGDGFYARLFATQARHYH